MEVCEHGITIVVRRGLRRMQWCVECGALRETHRFWRKWKEWGLSMNQLPDHASEQKDEAVQGEADSAETRK